MHTSDSYNQRKSLFNTMNRFIGAITNMDQTVMVPSLLRDVPLDDVAGVKTVTTANAAANGPAYFRQDTDMYSSYVLLKSIRNDMEWGVLQGDGRGRERVGGAEGEDDDLEKQFHFHVNGLHAVLSKLTRTANMLTKRYKEEIGCGH